MNHNSFIPHTLLSVLALCALAPAMAQQPVAPVGGAVPGTAPVLAPAATYSATQMIQMSPSDKRPLVLNESERNPYAKRSERDTSVNENGDNSEELQIRGALTSLSVTGKVQGENGLRILLGDIIIEKGLVLPDLVPQQSESLKVMEVTETSAVFAWLDVETGEPTGKTMQLAYDLTPSVRYALRGQASKAGESTSRKLQMGVMKVGQDRKKQSRLAASETSKDSSP